MQWLNAVTPTRQQREAHSEVKSFEPRSGGATALAFSLNSSRASPD